MSSFSLDTLQDLRQQINEMTNEKVDLEGALEESQRITRSKNEELLSQATRLMEMEHEIHSLRSELETRKETGEDHRQLVLDLEREKGKLAGVYIFSFSSKIFVHYFTSCAGKV